MAEKEKIDRALISEFECPVCFKYFQPPIRQCQQGHCFCGDCFKKIKRCSICRAQKSDARCFVLERMHALLTFPCRHIDEGCDFRGKGDAMKVHQTKCKFTTILCALRFNSCQWQGHRKDLMAHCNDVHPENTYTNNEQKLLVPDFPTLMHRHYYILFEVYETLFRCTWDLSIDTGTMRFAVYILEQNTTKGKFSYQVSMFTPDNEIAVLLRGPCVLLEDDSKRFLGDKYLSAKHGMAKEFCDEDGYFHYGIKLINHSL